MHQGETNIHFIFHCIIPETIILFKHFEHLSKTHWETLSPLLYQKDTLTEDNYICSEGNILKWNVDKGGLSAWIQNIPLPLQDSYA